MTRKFIQIIQQTNKKIDDNVFKQNIENIRIQSDIDTQLPYHYFDKLFRYDSGWEDIEIAGTYNAYKLWKYTFKEFDLRLLPYLSINHFFRRSGGEIEPATIAEDWLPDIHNTFQINENIQTYYSEVNLISSLHFNHYNQEESYQVKMVIQFINPRQYK